MNTSYNEDKYLDLGITTYSERESLILKGFKYLIKNMALADWFGLIGVVFMILAGIQ